MPRKRRRTTRRKPAAAGRTRRRSTRRRAAPRRRARGAGRRGSTAIAPIVGTVIGAGAAIGLGALTSMAIKAIRAKGKPASETEKTVAEYAPLVGAGVMAGLGYFVPKYKPLMMPAVIGAALVFALGKYQASKAKAEAGAGYYAARGYNQLRGAGSVARTLMAPSGAGSVARVLG